MPPRGRGPVAARVPPAPPPAPSSHSTTSGSSSLSPIKSGQSLSSDETSHEADAQPEGCSRKSQPDEDANEDDESPSEIVFRYPASVPDFTELSDREKTFKVARFLRCTVDGCDCLGLEPPEGNEVVLTTREEMDGDVNMSGDDSWRTDEGWWRRCGRCRHGWEEGEGHVFPDDVTAAERTRRGKVVGRIEEILQDDNLLTTFKTPEPDSITSLLKQLHHFVRPSGKKPALPFLRLLELSPDSGSPFSARNGTPAESEDERPRKRSQTATTAANGDAEAEKREQTLSPRHGKKPGGKTAGKGTKPRTVVRGARGLIPMEIDAAGDQHIAGRLPDSAVADEANDGDEEDEDEDEDEDEYEDIPLAKRPQLDEGERRRREVIKVKEKEREDEVVRRLTKGANVEVGGEGLAKAEPGVEVEVWEGVELPKLPPRPAAVEESRQEIMLTVVASRNPNPVASILLIGLKNLFQRQLPKMPREYITRLVLDKNHISMAIVKRGWNVVGGVCYRPFESRGFAEIVFFAVDSSEQIKGYGSHLMNSLKDHVRKAHPTINHFLTYADNYAVGYFKKQGFKKEISLARAQWVGYIKDYEGGTIMQGTMMPKVRYGEVHQMLADQKAAILAKIRTISKSHVVHPGLKVFRDKKEGEIRLSKEDVPGLAESGWNPDLDEIIRQPKRNPHHSLLQHVLNDLQDEPSAWPFVKPVDGNTVRDYYEVITNPMDLSTMEFKLDNNHYESVEQFVTDASLMFNNCRQYNGDKNTYTQQANKLEKALERILKKRQSPA